jgi:hypothetical protein
VTVPADAVPFTIAEAGLALSLPAGWNIADPIAAQGYSLYLLGPEAGISGGPDASQIIVADADQLTIEQFAEQQCSICPVQTVEDTTLNGQPAKRLIIGGGSTPEFVWHFLTANGRLIGLSLRPRDGQAHDWVLTTLTLTTASGARQSYSNTDFGFALDVLAGWIVDTPPLRPATSRRWPTSTPRRPRRSPARAVKASSMVSRLT